MSISILSFKVAPLNPPDELWLSAVPVVDGRALTDLVKELESNRGFDFGPINEYFCKTERISVLGCDCGEVGCWPLVCRVGMEGDTVTWHSFLQPHRAVSMQVDVPSTIRAGAQVGTYAALSARTAKVTLT